jgi:hypothetical protein
MAPVFWPAFRDQPRDDWPEWAVEFTESLIDIMEVAVHEMTRTNSPVLPAPVDPTPAP